ncbi:MAG: Stk1 family PASTA domain-containing Ser/Thr kinase [Clostridia bacterium]|nr:Stk1 family PASTA domain-containing Ser/Thr kinase [Clostridia bacterium]NCC42248.1 Stk1 family PASTA domain-containing Ser/Thr kinase [Clostridia bacterium]
MLKEGMIVGERYEIISRVGSGGMADVYKAKDHKLNRLVAVKVMKAEFSEDKVFISKFSKEAQAAAGLAHPNVVNVYDVGEDNGIYYIIMELVQGITLKDYITRKGKLSVREATSIAIQVSLGLEAAHRSNIIHRDVKPQNIIISTDGKVKLSDFGIARAASSNTISSNVMGSVHYSSPEQVRGGFSDAKSDIYSLGITMYEMVTGHVPFDGDTTVAIAIKHLQEEMESPRKYVPDIPYSLEQIIFKCTQKSVERRYSNMTDVITDLKHSLVDPEGNFVTLTPLASHAQTVMLSQDELEAIRDGRSGYAVSKKSAPEPAYEEDEDIEEDDAEYEDEDDEDEGEISSKLEKAMTIGGFIIGAIIICILIFFIARAAGLVNFGDADTDQQTEQEENPDEVVDENGQVTVPKITSMTEENAVSVLEQLGLVGSKSGEEESSEFPAGTIISQSIEAGEKADQGTTITYVVSTGSNQLSVPTVTGISQSEAEAKIKALGLETSIQQSYSDSVAIGRVISVEPGEGTAVTAGQTVTLTVSLGEENKQVAVPSVLGVDEATAKKTLNDSGFQVNVETTSTATGIAEGCVANQSIAAGTEADPGTTITLQIYHAPAATPTTVPDESNAQGTGTNTGSWTCNVQLEQPQNYAGGPIRLRLIQNVNGTNVETILLEGQTVTFPYVLTAAGADAVETGTVYLEEMVDGEYVERGHYSNVPFKQS